jgi:hypothetical protein
MTSVDRPNETQCTCPYPDARDCMKARYPSSYPQPTEDDLEHDEYPAPERCECVCHEPDPDEPDPYDVI